MNVFDLRRALLRDYQQFTRSFTRIRSDDIRSAVDGEYAGNRFWPEPLLQLNPRYKPAESMDVLIEQGILHPSCREIFAVEQGGQRVPLRLHQHQAEAAALGREGASFVVTTGTGSGKSLCFFLPIVSEILKAKAEGGTPRTRAIVIYPMNALANSQAEELHKFLGTNGSVTFGRYTGQESKDERAAIAAAPPDILLTNFMMLELLMVRQDDIDRTVIGNCQGLRFLVLDELHTYRGRQGADVAMLVRRVRERLGADGLQCIGTSATMASDGDAAERNRVVAHVASRLFATKITEAEVVTETLERATDSAATIDTVRTALGSAIDQPLLEAASADDAALAKYPLAVWTELVLGITRQPGAAWERAVPRTLEEASKLLATDSGRELAACRHALEQFLLLAARTEVERTGRTNASRAPFFAFKLHQWLSGAAFVYTTLEKPGSRTVTVDGQVYAPNKGDTRLYSTHFCRECGQEYHPVEFASDDTGAQALLARRIDDTRPQQDDEDDAEEGSNRRIGFVALRPSGEDPDFKFTGAVEDYPESWLELSKKGEWKLKPSRRKAAVEALLVEPNGRVGTGLAAWFMPGRFSFCLRCGVVHGTQGKDINRLAGLSAEGRSSATTMLTFAALRWMHGATGTAALQPHQRKLLGFTDNRQDAALQAGHFNDFVFQCLIRGAMLAATEAAGSAGLDATQLGAALQRALGFHDVTKQPDSVRSEWLEDPNLGPAVLQEAESVLRDVLAYRAWIDQRRGWRFTNPTLEQLGLVEPIFPALEALAADDSRWAKSHELMRKATPAVRVTVLRRLLLMMLQGLAIGGDTLQADRLEQVRDRSRQRLRRPWALGSEDDEQLRSGRWLLVRSVAKAFRQRDEDLFVRCGPQTPFGKFVKSRSTWNLADGAIKLDRDAYVSFVESLLDALRGAGLVLRDEQTMFGVPGWRLAPLAVRWRVPSTPPETRNAFFSEFYQTVAAQLQHAAHPLFGIEAREHTAQVRDTVRERREQRFRFGETDRMRLQGGDGREAGDGTRFLPLLFCSPTMELGVDISALNVVHLRNVPPTPANYSQRSGRAGRSGMAALVVTYCAAQSPHDQYFFRDPRRMVHGQVRAPLLDLANRDLIESHLHAVWLASTQTALSGQIRDVLDLQTQERPVQGTLLATMTTPAVLAEAEQSGRSVMAMLSSELTPSLAPWCPDADAFTHATMRLAAERFGRAFDRWRSLFSSAESQRDRATVVLNDYSATPEQRRDAQRDQSIANALISAMLDSGSTQQSDFYTYRYLATEGFLPGYNFPRLPLLACIPASRDGRREQAYLQRPRFLALSEFGPRALVYHEGRAFRVNRVRLGAQPDGVETGRLSVRAVRICTDCGAGDFEDQRNECTACGQPLASPEIVRDLYRIEHVDTQAAERITADDEERQRQGFELQSTFQWAVRDGKPDVIVGRAQDAQSTAILAFRYGPAATITRMNKGLRRRKDPTTHGFWINPRSGFWSKDLENADPTPPGQPQQTSLRIVPYVQEQKNALHLPLVDWLLPLPQHDWLAVVATLEYALKRGIETVFQLEESELLIEALPRGIDRRALLFYEATEGGAGVLTRLANEPDALARVARAALGVMHLQIPDDPTAPLPAASALTDLPNTDCVAGCYRCLLSYYNQPDHPLIDRRRLEVRELLVQLATSVTVTEMPTPSPVPAAGADLDPWTAAVLDFLTQARPPLPPVQLHAHADGTVLRWAEHYTFIAGSPVPASVRDALEDAGFMAVPFAADAAQWPSALARLRKNLE